MLELPVATGAGFGLSLLAASLIVDAVGARDDGALAGRRAASPRAPARSCCCCSARSRCIAAYGFTLLFSSEVWHILVANILIGAGIGFGYASMPMLIMRSVPQSETGASNGLNALFRSLGTSDGGGRHRRRAGDLFGGLQRTCRCRRRPGSPSRSSSAGAAALIALVVALFIPSSRDPHERHPLAAPLRTNLTP